MAAKCSAITLGGAPCKGLVQPGNDYCPAHDPARQEARRRAASKAGKSKPGRELADAKRDILDVIKGARVEDRTPRIKAKVRDEGDAVVDYLPGTRPPEDVDVRLFVDGEEVAATYNPETAIVSYTPSMKLSLGKHTVRVEATDASGNEAERSWSFRVVKRG